MTPTRADYLVAASVVKSGEIGELIAGIPEIVDQAWHLAGLFEGLDADMNLEGALRASTLQYLSPSINVKEQGNKLGLMCRFMEAALCLIDWTRVAEQVTARRTSSTRSSTGPSTTPPASS